VIVNVVGGIHPVCTQDLKYLKKQSAEMTESLQNDLSPKDWTIMFHLVPHMEEQLRRWGPVKDTWMFGFESFFGDMMSLIKSRSHPVASIHHEAGQSNADLERGEGDDANATDAGRGCVFSLLTVLLDYPSLPPISMPFPCPFSNRPS
jgi:hypothetical protein